MSYCKNKTGSVQSAEQIILAMLVVADALAWQ